MDKLDQHGQISYKFQDSDGIMEFVSNGRKSYVLTTEHCCFYCSTAKKSPEMFQNATFCLIRIEKSLPPRYEIRFAATFFLDTCLQLIKILQDYR